MQLPNKSILQNMYVALTRRVDSQQNVQVVDSLQNVDRRVRCAALLELASLLPLPQKNRTLELVTTLRRMLKVEDDKEVKKMIMTLLGRLAREPCVESENILEDLLLVVCSINSLCHEQ